MIYIIHGVSGPIKPLLIKTLRERYGDVAARTMINCKGTTRQKQSYDTDYDVKYFVSKADLYKEYPQEYTYTEPGGKLFSINIKQIEQSIESGNSHYIICHDIEMIKKLKKDVPFLFKKQCKVDLLDIKFSNVYRALQLLCAEYNDDIKKRNDKLNTLKSKLEKENITHDTVIEIKYSGEDKTELERLFSKELEKTFSQDTYYQWARLLNTQRIFSDEHVDKNDFMAFEDDNWKVINSAAFRRLQDKAQVFPLEKLDYARTRLTHSYECAAIAEELGVRVLEVIDRKASSGSPIFNNKLCIKIPILLKTAALLHDMGNPPFGHFGEELIRNWFEKAFERGVLKDTGNLLSDLKNDFINFEGNAQLLRILTSLDSADKSLNLTLALLSIVIKYPIDSRHIDKSNLETKKAGYFFSEKSFFEKIKQEMFLKGRHPLTFLLEAADDISYLTADLQDAYKKDLVSIDEIRRAFKDNGCIDVCQELDKLELEKLKGIDLSLNGRCKKEINSYIINELHHYLKKIMIDDVVNAFDQQYEKIMSGEKIKELLSINERTENIDKAIRDILKTYVYNGTQISQSQIRSARIINCVLETFVQAAIDIHEPKMALTSRVINNMSWNYVQSYLQTINNLEAEDTDTNRLKAYYQLLLATDNVCGMTDSYAKEMYKMLNAD